MEDTFHINVLFFLEFIVIAITLFSLFFFNLEYFLCKLGKRLVIIILIENIFLAVVLTCLKTLKSDKAKKKNFLHRKSDM